MEEQNGGVDEHDLKTTQTQILPPAYQRKRTYDAKPPHCQTEVPKL